MRFQGCIDLLASCACRNARQNAHLPIRMKQWQRILVPSVFGKVLEITGKLQQLLLRKALQKLGVDASAALDSGKMLFEDGQEAA